MENKVNETDEGDDNEIIDVPVVVAYDPGKLELDETGYFVIEPDPERMLILAKNYSYDKKLLRIIEGTDAESIHRTIIKCKWVNTLDHAAYLGQELARAEIAMKAGFKYIQG